MQKTDLVFITLLVYMLVLIAIGFWSSRRTRSGDDFFLGGRGLGPFVAALSYSSSAASAWTLLGLSGIAYAYGVSTVWVAFGSILSAVAVWTWVAPRLMVFSREHKLISLTEVMRHNDSGRWAAPIVWLSSAVLIFSFVLYVAAQFQGAGVSLASTFAISKQSSIALGAFIIMLYTLLGGFWAVSLTDAVQGVVMAITALVLPVACFIAVGGVEGLISGLSAAGNPALLSLTAKNVGLGMLGIIIGGLGIGLGAFGQPHLMARIMALRDEKAMRQARMIAIGWYLIVFLGMWFVGLAGHVLHAGLENPETIFFVVLEELFPPVIGAIFLAAVLSAIMSTADSQLLATATALANDLGLASGSPKKVLLVSRLAIVIVVVGAVFVALLLPATIFDRVLFAWMAIGAAFGPVLIFRMAGIAVKAKGVFLAILLGFGLTVTLSLLPDTTGDIAERLLPFFVATLTLLIFRSRPTAQ